MSLKHPKGTQDYYGKTCKIRYNIMHNVRLLFELFGSQELDTPVFELSETLNGKYGEEGTKLIYNLKDQGGELLSLKYDLTVPMCRYISQNKLARFVRHQFQKVYRRDNPRMTLGRYREFYQCDLDIAGNYFPMIADAEIFSALGLVLKSLQLLSSFSVTIKVNHRKILDGIFLLCGVEQSSFRMVSSAIDKLDKIPWGSVRKELVEEKQIPERVADEIGRWTQLSGVGVEFLKSLLKIGNVNDEIKIAVNDLLLLEDYLKDDPIYPFIKYDLSLARGLDYYTGVIFEAVISDAHGVGSVAAGGRFDHLVEYISNDKFRTPCVGMSLGLERIVSLVNSSSLSEQDIARAEKLIETGASKQKELGLLKKYQTYQKILEIKELALSNFKSENIRLFVDSGKTAQVCVIRCDDSQEVLKYARKVANIIRREVKTSVQFRMTEKARSPTDQIIEYVNEHSADIAVFVSQKGLNKYVNIKQLVTKRQIVDVFVEQMCDIIVSWL